MKFPYSVVAITGASSGIGAELAAQLSDLGCKVGLMARRKDKLDELVKRIHDKGGSAIAAACDVADNENVKAAVAEIEQTLGPIDCMIANAGVGEPMDANVFDPDVTETIFRVNVLGMTNAFYAVVPGMLERKQGRLVGVASLASYQGMPQDAGYSASKAAMRIHCESMRTELRGSGVGVTCICPGFIRTPMTDRNEFDMPFLQEVQPSCRKMIKAIAKGRRVYNFPWQLWWLIKIGVRSPRWMYDRVISSQMKKSDSASRSQKRSTDS